MPTTTVCASAMASWDLATIFLERLNQAAWVEAALQALFGLIVACLIWGGLVYQLTRFIHLRRCMKHRPATDAQLQDFLISGLL